MRRSTALMAQLEAQHQRGTALNFENAIGGYFSVLPEYGLKVKGDMAQDSFVSPNLFPLGDIENRSSWWQSVLMDNGAVKKMLRPSTVYTVSFDAIGISVPPEAKECEDSCVCGTMNRIYQDENATALGFILVRKGATDGADCGFDVTVPHEGEYVRLFETHPIREGETFHGSVTFTAPESLEGYYLAAVTVENQYAHSDYPECENSTVTFKNIQITEGDAELPYLPYTGGKTAPNLDCPLPFLCVKAGTGILCGESEITVPCDLYSGDIWYPSSGRVERYSAETEAAHANNQGGSYDNDVTVLAAYARMHGRRPGTKVLLSHFAESSSTVQDSSAVLELFSAHTNPNYANVLYVRINRERLPGFTEDNANATIDSYMDGKKVKVRYIKSTPTIEQYPPQAAVIQKGTARVTQKPTELEAELEATVAAKRG